jgi:hypothetical protein
VEIGREDPLYIQLFMTINLHGAKHEWSQKKSIGVFDSNK